MVNLFLGQLGNTRISNELHSVFLSKHVTCLVEFLEVLSSFLLNFLLVCGPLSIGFGPSLLDNLLKLWVVKPHCFKHELLPLMCRTTVSVMDDERAVWNAVAFTEFFLLRGHLIKITRHQPRFILYVVSVDCLAFLFKSSVWSSTSSSTRVFLFLGFGAVREMVSDTGPCFPFFLTNSSITSNSYCLFRFLSFRGSPWLGLPSDALFCIVSSVLMMFSIGGVAISSWTTSVASWSTCIFRWSADDRLGRSTLYKVQSRGKDYFLPHFLYLGFCRVMLEGGVLSKGGDRAKLFIQSLPVRVQGSWIIWLHHLLNSRNFGITCCKVFKLWLRIHHMIRQRFRVLNIIWILNFHLGWRIHISLRIHRDPRVKVKINRISSLRLGLSSCHVRSHNDLEPIVFEHPKWEPNQSHKLHPSAIQSSQPSEGIGTPKATLYRPGPFIKNLLPIFFNIEMDDIVPTYSSNYSHCSSEVPAKQQEHVQVVVPVEETHSVVWFLSLFLRVLNRQIEDLENPKRPMASPQRDQERLQLEAWRGRRSVAVMIPGWPIREEGKG
ncbi:uncharacterized protein G2W53_041497 [Senna tora]|uniref:Uncharacterized protein n=1 Tax=Senna tora TaxID=362788 RepID=A0A834W1G0_9FABA|nr:uncharacterized protein G2W53_041497 [Senna tora]